ncbi:MAG: cation-efflux pump [Thermoflexia bacterium]|nr:MAG: cation-efflux pump [Thermoflexia bacterium]
MSPSHSQSASANREKGIVALSSVLAAVFLTLFKLIVGLATNSLGILSEAAHSGLDLIAALLTFLAVRLAGRPADRSHPFGHGKIENLSALIETLLLLLTCAWIIYEAVQRLVVRTVVVEATAWSFLVMGLAIGVDVGRSRALYRVARKYNSQALEADALHFSTDVWSSSVVIGGLVLVRLADVFPQYRIWLLRADAMAALVVAGIVVWVSLQLGRRTLDALLDRAPEGLEERVRTAIQSVPHVQGCGPIRLRTAGPITFVEATVHVAPDIPAGMAHEVATRVEEAVALLCSDCDVTVHVEPAAPDDVAGQVRAVAADVGLHVHDIHIHHLEDGYHVHLDLEVPGRWTLKEAHRKASAFEEALRERVPEVAGVETHIEVAPAIQEGPGIDVTDAHRELLDRVREIVESRDGVVGCHDLHLRQVGDGLYLSLHCVCPPEMPMEEAHCCAAQVEGIIRREFPFLTHVLIHTEPG